MKSKNQAIRRFTSLLFLIASVTANATTYYVSNSGSDSNNGTSTSTPWKSINKVNSFFTSLKPGDNVLFNRGGTFYGGITISKSGSSGSPITFGAYGTGANPIITGFTTVSGWTNLGGNIWESINTVSSLAACNMVLINGVNTPMGRYPNSGYATYQSFVGTTSITSSSLNGSTNWTGADVVIKKRLYIIEKDHITAQSGGTLTYAATSTFPGVANWGFFIQNDARTLDAQNEWYYNASTKKIRVYSSSSPANVQVSSVDNLVSSRYQNYISFSNIAFKGGSSSAFYLGSSSNISIQNCSIDFCNDGVNGYDQGLSSANFKLQNSTINHSNNIAVNLSTEFSNASVTNNIIKYSGLVPGMAKIGEVAYQGIYTSGSNSTIAYNEVDSSGYIGIGFNGSSVQVNHNLVNYFCILKDDGAGIYTTSPNTGSVISYNIVLNGIGNKDGTTNPLSSLAEGIYLDNNSTGIEVSNNSAANMGDVGFYLHNNTNIVFKNNTSFNNAWLGLDIRNDLAGSYVRGITMKNNILVSKTTSQKTVRYYTLHNDFPSFGTLDSNYYARPMDDNLTINVLPNGDAKGSESNKSLPLWQSFSGFDNHSHKSPKAVTTANDLRFEFNATNSNKTITLDGTYIDVKSASYNGSITLAPYTSAVLIRNGAATNQAPTANAGTDLTVTLPVNSVNLSGSGTDPDGSISSYAWTKVSGPSAGTINSAGSALTTVTALAQGVYIFQLKVTDNAGASGVNTVQVTVNASGGTLLPAVNPANTVNGLNYSYYESPIAYILVPIFSAILPVKTGITSNFDVSISNRLTVFAFNFTGYVNVPSDGQYTFYTTSDDGSTLLIDNVPVVNNDGLHAAIEKSGTIGLKAGKHAISVGYFQRYSDRVLSVSYSGPGVSKQTIPSTALYRVSTSGLVAVSNNGPSIMSSAPIGIKAYPNPFVNSIEIDINSDAGGEYELVFIDALGRVLWTKKGDKSPGQFQQTINTSAFQRGVYFLKVIQNNTTSVIKVVK